MVVNAGFEVQFDNRQKVKIRTALFDFDAVVARRFGYRSLAQNSIKISTWTVGIIRLLVVVISCLTIKCVRYQCVRYQLSLYTILRRVSTHLLPLLPHLGPLYSYKDS